MGKLASRFANKKHPLYAAAKEVVSLAANHLQVSGTESVFNEGISSFTALLKRTEALLETLTVEEFEKLTDLVVEIAEPRRDAEELLAGVFSAIESNCEIYESRVGVPGYLVAVPVVVVTENTGALVHIDALSANALTDLFCEQELIATNSTVSFLPRLLSAWELEMLKSGDVFRLGKCLGDNKTAEALAMVEAVTKRVGPWVHSDNWEAHGSSAVSAIVVYVESEDTDPFPLSSVVMHELRQMYVRNDDNLAAEGYPEQGEPLDTDCEALCAEVEAELGAWAPVLAKVLRVLDAKALAPPEDWFAGVKMTARKHRALVAAQRLHALAVTLGVETIRELSVSEEFGPISGPELGIKVSVFPRATGADVAFLDWFALHEEGPEECAAQLQLFLDKYGISPALPEVPAQAQVPRSRVLH